MEQRVERIEERLKKLEQGQTEPIKVTRIEIDTGGVLERLDALDRKLGGIGERQTDHGEKFDTLVRGQQELKDRFGQGENVHFDVMVKTIEDSAVVFCPKHRRSRIGLSDRYSTISQERKEGRPLSVR